MKVDFDTEEGLRQEHEVTKQHTLVLINENKENISWNGSKTLSEIINNIK